MPGVPGLNSAALSKLASVTGGLSAGKIGGILAGLKGGLAGGKFNIGSLTGMLSAIKSGQTAKFQSYSYKYQVATYQILLEGRKEPINLLKEAIQKVLIERDYDKSIHPILIIVTTLPPKLHKLIKDNKGKVKIRLNIQKGAYDKGSGERMRSKPFIDDKFSLIMNDESDFKDEETYEAANKGAGGDGRNDKYIFNAQDYTTEYVLSLWNQDHIDAMRKPVNAIYKDCTVSNAIQNIYSKATGIKKILISPMDNTNKYSEIRVKPMNLMNVPGYIDKVYGTYYTGSEVFLDFRCLYFLSKNGVCDAKEKGEYTRTIFRIPKSDKSKKDSVGTTIDTTNKFYYINLRGEDIDFQAPGNTNDATEGNNFNIIDPKNNETMNVEGVGEQSSNGNSRIVEDNYSNEYNKSTLMSDVVEKSKECYITVTDYDDDAMTPNKEFIVMFDNEKLKDKNGFYRLKKSQVILNKSSANLEITGKHVLAFKAAAAQGEGEDKTSVTNTETMSKESKMSDANKAAVGASTATPTANSAASTNASSESFKPTAPQPKVKGLDKSTVDVTGGKDTIADIPKNNNYKYDSLGNLKGIDVPSYNKVLPSDDIQVTKAKIAAQQKMLPCKGPQPKLQKI